MGTSERLALVERDHELEAIDAALAGVDEGMGAFLSFDGEPGVGKSALLRELIARAGELHVRVLSARATPIEQDVPFAAVVLIEALARSRSRVDFRRGGWCPLRFLRGDYGLIPWSVGRY
jgi:predicted ATPase